MSASSRRPFRRPSRLARTFSGLLAGALAAVTAGATVTACARFHDRAAEDRRGTEDVATDVLAVVRDSTYWVTTGPTGARLRAAPLFLARWGGRLAEVYVADDAVRFPGADFSTARVYRRDLLTGDSVLVTADPEVSRLAARYAAAHPEEHPLDPDDVPDEDAPLTAEQAIRLLAAHGPYLTLETRLTVDGPDGSRRERLHRRVVDLRTGRAASLATLFGPRAVAALTAAGRRAFVAALDTLRALETRADAPDGAVDSVRIRALAAVTSLRFDPASFGLATVDGGPAVQFVAVGADEDGALTLALPPVSLGAAARSGEQFPEPAWWAAEVRPLLPAGAPDAARLLARAWPSGAVPPEAPQLLRLDRPPADRALRRALRRAFDESAFYDDVTTSVAWRPSATCSPPCPRSLRAPRARASTRPPS